MPEPTPEAWAQIRHDYEHTDKPLAHICAEHGITVPTMRYRMKCWEWRRRKPLIPRQGPPPVAVVQQEMAAPPTPYAAPLHATPPAFATASAHSRCFASASLFENGAQRAPMPPPQEPAPGRAQARPGWEGEEPIAIVPRLQAAAARVLPAIEATVARLASGELNSRDLEKTGRTLATLTRTLRELNALLVQHNAPLQPDDDPVPEDMDEFRDELARRIRSFIEARKNEQDAQLGQEAGPETQKGCLPNAAMDGTAGA